MQWLYLHKLQQTIISNIKSKILFKKVGFLLMHLAEDPTIAELSKSTEVRKQLQNLVKEFITIEDPQLFTKLELAKFLIQSPAFSHDNQFLDRLIHRLTILLNNEDLVESTLEILVVILKKKPLIKITKDY